MLTAISRSTDIQNGKSAAFSRPTVRQKDKWAVVSRPPYWRAASTVVATRVGNRISFRKNSEKYTRNGVCYSAEESAHSKAFRAQWKTQFRSSERKGIKWRKKKIIFWSNQNNLHRIESVFYVPSIFLFRGMVWNRNLRVFCQRNSRNSVRTNHFFVSYIPSSAEFFLSEITNPSRNNRICHIIVHKFITTVVQ